MRAALVAGGGLSEELDPRVLGDSDLLVAVDAGAEAVVRSGVVPSVLIGDLDSVSSRTLSRLEAHGVETISLPRAKDETDLEAALRLVVERGAEEIDIYGALGGPRLDHLLGNVLLLTSSWLAEVRVRLVDPRHTVFLVRGDARLSGRPGDQVSLLPISERVEGVRTEGLVYPLSGETLARSSTRGVSNELAGTEARVTHGPGELLLVHYREGRA